VTLAERWTAAHGFTVPGDYRNKRGEHVDDLLSREPGVTLEGTTLVRWRFTNGSAIVARFGLSEVQE
jgi:hypothetical protein